MNLQFKFISSVIVWTSKKFKWQSISDHTPLEAESEMRDDRS